MLNGVKHPQEPIRKYLTHVRALLIFQRAGCFGDLSMTTKHELSF